MSEVNREEHIKRLKAYKECRKKQVKGIWEECNSYLCDNCKLCYEQGNAGEHISTIKKAISDMEKLQRIEALYGIDKFGAVLTREERDREVQKILDGE